MKPKLQIHIVGATGTGKTLLRNVIEAVLAEGKKGFPQASIKTIVAGGVEIFEHTPKPKKTPLEAGVGRTGNPLEVLSHPNEAKGSLPWVAYDAGDGWAIQSSSATGARFPKLRDAVVAWNRDRQADFSGLNVVDVKPAFSKVHDLPGWGKSIKTERAARIVRKETEKAYQAAKKANHAAQFGGGTWAENRQARFDAAMAKAMMEQPPIKDPEAAAIFRRVFCIPAAMKSATEAFKELAEAVGSMAPCGCPECAADRSDVLKDAAKNFTGQPDATTDAGPVDFKTFPSLKGNNRAFHDMIQALWATPENFFEGVKMDAEPVRETSPEVLDVLEAAGLLHVRGRGESALVAIPRSIGADAVNRLDAAIRANDLRTVKALTAGISGR